MKKKHSLFFLSLLFCFLTINSHAQYNLSGTIADSLNGNLEGVSVLLLNPKDSTVINQKLTNLDGFFEFSDLRKNKYLLKINTPGYKDSCQNIDLIDSVNLKVIYLHPSYALLEGFEVSATFERVVQKGDTTEFNADAFKVSEDAQADKLLKKLPGIQIVDGKIQADGKEVTKILVDGKPFFSGNSGETVAKLPAAAVSKVQVYEEKSEQAKFTGIEDGELEKTINIVTKPSFRNSLFGDAFAGIGYPMNYDAGFVANSFRNDEKITVNAKFGDEEQDFLKRTNASAGINYVNTIGNWEISGSYNLNYFNNENQFKKNRLYITKETEGLTYNELSDTKSKSFSHTFSFDVKWKIDTMNTIIFRPKISFQKNENTNNLAAENQLFDTIINTTETQNHTNSGSSNLSLPINYNRSFVKKGRTLSINVNPQIILTSGDGSQEAIYSYYDTINRIDFLNTKYNSNGNDYTFSGNISYSEPLVKEKLFLQFSYRTNYNPETYDKTTYNIKQNGESNIDTALSNKFNDLLFTNSGSMGLRFSSEKFDISLRGTLTHKQQKNDKTFPIINEFEQSYLNFLPNIWLNWKITKNNRAWLYASSYTQNPSSRQMQEIVDISNPLQLYSGNSELSQSINNYFSMSYNYTKPTSSISLRAYLSANYTINPIGTSTVIASKTDTLSNGIILQPGAQYTTPINFDNSYNHWGNINFSIPVKWIKCNFSTSLGNNFSYSQSKINGNINDTYNNSLSPSLRLSSNISEQIDFSVFGGMTYTTVSNTIQKELNSKYSSSYTGFNLGLEFFERLFFNTDLNWSYYSSFGNTGKSQKTTEWNASIGYKFLKKKQLHVTISVSDILAQNLNLTRNVEETYYEEVHQNIFSRYIMLQLKWKFTTFKDGKTPEVRNNQNHIIIRN